MAHRQARRAQMHIHRPQGTCAELGGIREARAQEALRQGGASHRGWTLKFGPLPSGCAFDVLFAGQLTKALL